MRSSLKVIFFLALLIMLSGCAATYQPKYIPTPIEELAAQIDQQIAIPELATALVGIMVQSAES